MAPDLCTPQRSGAIFGIENPPVSDINNPMADAGRPSRGLTERFLARMTRPEREMLEMLSEQLDCPLNDALRVSIRRGYARVGPSPDVDGPVLDPDWSPQPFRPVPHITGQTTIDDTIPET